jgi:hypothetical protein
MKPSSELVASEVGVFRERRIRLELVASEVGVSTRSGFPVFGQNREPEPGYPGSLFWETGTGTGIPVKPGSRLPAGSGFTRSGNRFFKKKKKKNFLGLYIGSF